MFEKERERMVREQIMWRNVSAPDVLKAMRKVPRHEFVPPEMRKYAYEDNALPLSEGQTISQPYIVAYMSELLEVKSNHRVLEIGTGSGYQTAVLAEIVKEVYTIEIIESLYLKAKETLKKLNYTNIYFKLGDGYEGWREHAPYDGIIITSAPEEIPEEILPQLKPGGIMVVPVGVDYQEIYKIKKGDDGENVIERTISVRFVPMVRKPKIR